MQATNGLCSHAKACLESSARGEWGAITVSWGARRSRQRASRKDYRASHDNDEDGEGILRGSALTFFMPPHSWTTRLPCEETRAKSACAPEPGWVTENRTDAHEAPTVNTIFRWVAGRPRETPEPATHASGPTPRNLLSPRRDRGTPPESLGGARKAWRHAPANAQMVQTTKVALLTLRTLPAHGQKLTNNHKASHVAFSPQRSRSQVASKTRRGQAGKLMQRTRQTEEVCIAGR